MVVGLATLGSFWLAVHDAVAGIGVRRRSSTRVEVSGDDNDVDLHLHGRGTVERSDPAAANEPESEGIAPPRFPSKPGGNGTGNDESLEEN